VREKPEFYEWIGKGGEYILRIFEDCEPQGLHRFILKLWDPPKKIKQPCYTTMMDRIEFDALIEIDKATVTDNYSPAWLLYFRGGKLEAGVIYTPKPKCLWNVDKIKSEIYNYFGFEKDEFTKFFENSNLPENAKMRLKEF